MLTYEARHLNAQVISSQVDAIADTTRAQERILNQNDNLLSGSLTRTLVELNSLSIC
jgi:hypothetical protein